MAGSIRAEYEKAVIDLGELAQQLRSEGLADQAIARALVDRRNQLKVRFRKITPPELVDSLERRNRRKYGHPVGPTADQQLEKYGSWNEVIEAASRPFELSKLL